MDCLSYFGKKHEKVRFLSSRNNRRRPIQSRTTSEFGPQPYGPVFAVAGKKPVYLSLKAWHAWLRL